MFSRLFAVGWSEGQLVCGRLSVVVRVQSLVCSRLGVIGWCVGRLRVVGCV